MDNNMIIEDQFNEWKKILEEKTMFMSSIHSMQEIQEYKNILELNAAAIPLIINELNLTPVTSIYWFSLLHDITGENPVLKEHRGINNLMSQDWIFWWLNKYTTDNT